MEVQIDNICHCTLSALTEEGFCVSYELETTSQYFWGIRHAGCAKNPSEFPYSFS